MNPLIPTVGDLACALAVIANLVLVTSALWVLRRRRARREWLPVVLFVLFVPFAGPILALALSRRPTPSWAPRSDDEAC